MAFRQIVVELNETLRNKSVLHTVCDEIVHFDGELKVLVDDMIETLHKTNDAVGLAAPQIGILKRVAVVDIGQGPVVLINPEVIEKSGAEVGVEGCLSYPDVWAQVKRPTYVKVKTSTLNGEVEFVEGKGFAARAFCHEIDHLNGIVFLDRAQVRISKEELDKLLEDNSNLS